MIEEEILLDRIQEKEIRIVTITDIHSHVVQETGVYMQASLRPPKEEELAEG
jgi:hypothetical protein